jgi:hypothetical protein
MNEAKLAIARKIILCAGLLVAALLFLFPHWRHSINLGDGTPTANQELGRAFIASPPLPGAASSPYQFMFVSGPGEAVRIHHVRQFTEVAIALLLTFGLMGALKLKKPSGDGKHDVEK